jgi:hypothetical protein
MMNSIVMRVVPGNIAFAIFWEIRL